MSESIENTSPQKDLTGMISSLLSNPDALSKMSSVLSKYTNEEIRDTSPQSNDFTGNSSNNTTTNNELSENSSDTSTTSQIQENRESTFDFGKIASLLGNANEAQFKQQTALLLAIRPYLSPKRQELIDGFISISRLSGIFNNLA